MKNTSLLTAAIASVVLTTVSAFAGNGDCSASCRTSSQKPSPVHVVAPTEIPRQYENLTVQVAFTIDEAGVPHNVTPVGRMPKDLAARLLPAVAQWRFSPSYVNGRAVSKRVILPLELVEGA